MKYLAIAIGLPLLLLILAYAYIVMPSVYSVKSSRGVIIHCEVLGEYPSDVARIEISEVASGSVIWRVKAAEDKFQLHNFEVIAGPNVERMQPYSGKFIPEIPSRGAFYLKKGTSYRASVCAPDWLGLCRTTEFVL